MLAAGHPPGFDGTCRINFCHHHEPNRPASSVVFELCELQRSQRILTVILVKRGLGSISAMGMDNSDKRSQEKVLWLGPKISRWNTLKLNERKELSYGLKPVRPSAFWQTTR